MPLVGYLNVGWPSRVKPRPSEGSWLLLYLAFLYFYRLRRFRKLTAPHLRQVCLKV
jgi:hypothetical protein